jgi:non-ribosomal peptide synthetase component F
MFVLLEEEPPDLRFGDAACRPLPVTTSTSKNDLLLSIQAHGEEWTLSLEYSTDLFTAETASRMAGHLTELFKSIASNPAGPIGLLDLMTADERHQVLVEWNDTANDYPRDKCIHELFEQQAQRLPDAIAVTFKEQSLTYRELNERSSKVARQLHCRGLKPKDIVALRVDRSAEMIVGLLGILKAGGTYWAIDEKLPAQRLLVMVEEAKPKFILSNGPSIDRIAETISKVRVEAGKEAMRILTLQKIEATQDENTSLPHQTNPSDPAYVCYTSGSTGRPKGVVVPHRGVVRLVKGSDYVTLDSTQTLLHHSPLSFDASTFETYQRTHGVPLGRAWGEARS